jgi:hypothetical protein
MPGLTLPTRTSSRGKAREKEEWGEDGGGAEEQGGRRGEGRKQRRNAAGHKQARLTPQPTTTTTTTTTAQTQYPSLAAPKLSPNGGKFALFTPTTPTHSISGIPRRPTRRCSTYLYSLLEEHRTDKRRQAIIYTCKVLHRVLYPRCTVMEIKKKKKKKIGLQDCQV